MNLLILAAGYGGRISPVTLDTPKALLELGNGKTILDLQLEAAASANFNSITVVTGYMSEKIEAKLVSRTDLGLDIEWLYNPFFRTTNNMVSLWVGRSAMTHDFVMLNGDDLFHPSVLSELTATPHDLVAVISRKTVYDADDTKIATEGDEVKRIGKTLPVAEANAEWIGMCAFRGDARHALIEKMDIFIREGEYRNGPFGYLPLLQSLIDSGVHFGFMEIEHTMWAEVDFQMDLDFVRSNLTRFME